MQRHTVRHSTFDQPTERIVLYTAPCGCLRIEKRIGAHDIAVERAPIYPSPTCADGQAALAQAPKEGRR